MKKAIDFFTAHPARFFLLAALLWGGFMCFLNYKDGANFSWHDLLVEANGMVFDLLVFGILLSIYEALREKRNQIERLQEEINHYRGWKEQEATIRIVGAVRRLKKLKVSNVNLYGCFLEGAKLMFANLEGANLNLAELKGADLSFAHLKGAYLEEAHLEKTIFYRANLEGANLKGTNLKGADLGWAKLEGADLWGANLEGTMLRDANLQGAHLFKANFQEAYLFKANFQNAWLNEANLQNANLDEANFQNAIFWGTDLQGASFIKSDLRNTLLNNGAIVGIDWFEKLEEWQVIGREEIKAKYFIDEQGVLREKQ